VLLAKPGLNGHDRGVKVIALALRDAGMEVIYTGIRQSAAMIAEAALQEDVEVLGLSILSGAHNSVIPDLVRELRARGLERILIVVGGIIPESDVPRLLEQGVDRVFGPGTALAEIASHIETRVRVLRDAEAADVS
jgi:methylmalonyl-CoA mutase C-terminal domain/subunit